MRTYRLTDPDAGFGQDGGASSITARMPFLDLLDLSETEILDVFGLWDGERKVGKSGLFEMKLLDVFGLRDGEKKERKKVRVVIPSARP